jgi:DNA-3-methyladenine glycosylase I
MGNRLNRCFGTGNKLYEDYHDNEWGVALHDDNKLFEMLILEGAQAGLSWAIILKKREGYKKAFHNFNPILVSQMSEAELELLRENPEIVRNRLKIYSVRINAKIFLAIQKEFGSFDKYIWAFVNGNPIVNNWANIKELPSQTPLSDRVSKDLKKRGMKFVGSTIIYAFMQAVGMVNDHIKECWKSNQ